MLQGFNVIGAIVAWGLCGLALLENPSSASLTSVPGNSFIRVLKRATQPIERLLGGHKHQDDALGLPTTAVQRPADLEKATSSELKLDAPPPHDGQLGRAASTVPPRESELAVSH